MPALEKVSRYDVLEKIAESGFAVVYKGRDPASRRLVAIKISVAQDEALRSRFLREAEKASALLHPNIARIFEFGSGDGRPYLVEEFLAGPDLRSLIRTRRPTDGVREMELLLQVANAMHHAHKSGVLHRDLKPATVHLEEGGQVKLVDFGLARLGSAAAWLSGDRDLLDAAGYLPPELALGLEADARTDVYCFGALAHELLAGVRPFAGENLPELVRQALGKDPTSLLGRWPACPPELSDLVGRCLARDPGERYASFEPISGELQAILEEVRLRLRRPNRATVVAIDSREARRATATRSGGGSLAAASATAPLPLAVPLDLSAQPATQPVSLDDTMAIPPDLIVGPPPDSPPALQIEPPELELPELEPEEESLNTAYLLDPPGGPLAAVEAGLADDGTVPVEELKAAAAAENPVRTEAAAAAPARPAAALPGKSRRRWIALALVALAVLATGGWWLASQVGGLRPAPVAPPRPAAASAPRPAVAPPTGLLVVDASPWAQVTAVVDEAGRAVPLPVNRFTPLAIRLPAGRYEATLTRPGTSNPASCTTVVVVGRTAQCRAALGRVDVTDYFKQAGWWR